MNNVELIPQWIILLYIFIIGICTGSFLNVAILRGLTGEDIVFDRSHCPKCKNQLKWYMNIPLLSYIFLRGKCAYCKEHISFQYPIIEFLVGILFVYSYLVFGFTLKTLFVWIFLSIFTLLATTDIKETVIIDYHTYILLAFGLIYSFFNIGDITIIQSLIGGISGFLLFELVARSGLLFVKHRIFGEGDSLIALALGSIFGLKTLLIITFLSILIQAIFTIPSLVYKSYCEKKVELAFSYILVFFGIIFVSLENYFKIITNELIQLVFAVFVSLLLIYALKNVLKELKEKKEMVTDSSDSEKIFYLLPFGPALIFASFLCIFYLPEIKKIILTFFN